MSSNGSIVNRRYPRIPLNDAASLKVIRHRSKVCSWDTLKVRVRSASCEGVGLVLIGEPPEPLKKRDKIELTLLVGGRTVLIPGRIVWSHEQGQLSLDLGIQFDLALAREMDRKQYSTWVVQNIVRIRDA